MRTAGDAFCVRDRLRRLCEEWSRSPGLVAPLCPKLYFLLRCRFCTRRLEGMLCVHVQCHDEGIWLMVG